MEDFAVIDDRQCRPLDEGQLLFCRQPAAYLQNKFRNVDLAGTYLLTFAAPDAEALNVLRRFQFIKPRGKDGADAAGTQDDSWKSQGR